MKFGLCGYQVYFKHEPLETALADIFVDLTQMTVTVRLDSNPKPEDKPHMNIKHLARHEATHLLIGRLAQNAKTRYICELEMTETIEELVNKLEGLID